MLPAKLHNLYSLLYPWDIAQHDQSRIRRVAFRV
jgi:hypothetical protein